MLVELKKQGVLKEDIAAFISAYMVSSAAGGSPSVGDCEPEGSDMG